VDYLLRAAFAIGWLGLIVILADTARDLWKRKYHCDAFFLILAVFTFTAVFILAFLTTL